MKNQKKMPTTTEFCPPELEGRSPEYEPDTPPEE